jgi:hypothetical protein
MWHVLLFYALLLGGSGYALAWGGAPERLFVFICLTGFAASLWVETPFSHRFRHVELGLLFVDFAMFCALYLLSIFSTRFWPIWMTAMQGLVVLAHVVALTPQPSPFGYQALEEFWSFPQLMLLIVAVRRHRQRLARIGTDPPWTTSFARLEPPGPH